MEENYKYGLLSDTTLILFNDTEHRANPLNTEFLEDVKIQINDHGYLEITAKRIIFDFYSFRNGHRIFEKSWIRQPHKREIHEGRQWWWSRKKERFVRNGFVRSTETENVHYILSIYKIEIFD